MKLDQLEQLGLVTFHQQKFFIGKPRTEQLRTVGFLEFFPAEHVILRWEGSYIESITHIHPEVYWSDPEQRDGPDVMAIVLEGQDDAQFRVLRTDLEIEVFVRISEFGTTRKS